MKLKVNSFRAFENYRVRRYLQQIEQLGVELRSQATAELRKRSLSLRYRALADDSRDDLLPEAFALIRETASRTLGLRHFDVQLIGGIALHLGKIAVMQTGEGKTLTATAPLYLAALRGRGAHLLTANDYLAQRDAEMMKPLFETLGLSIGYITSESTPEQRRQAYACDVTYSTAKEIGFDFLRDRLQKRKQLLGLENRFQSLLDGRGSQTSTIVLRDFYFAIVDEADNILIDEARTPLVVSGSADGGLNRIELFRWAAEVAKKLKAPKDFERDEARRQIELTTAGRQLARKLAATPGLASFPLVEIYEQLTLAIVVDNYYLKDRHYIVRDGEVVIVDEFTGRLAEGRKWRAGLHQAIEAREGVEITDETDEVARVTIQNLFLKYPRLAGMTGTIGNSAIELETIYRTPVIEVPTHRPPQRIAYDEIITSTDVDKWQRIADEVAAMCQQGRPVLVGTRSIDKSRLLSQILTNRGILHDVLNAQEHEREAEIVMHAGEFRKVTVATNMAGRGTDIKLDAVSLELGGLHVICSELHDSARIDRQLIGRAGRQGDPGSYRQYMSLEDEILSAGLRESHWRRLTKLSKTAKGELSSQFARHFRLAQRRIEKRNFEGRKILMFQENSRHEMQGEMGQDPYLDAAG
jgi:preprotein translocase subunit SecA